MRVATQILLFVVLKSSLVCDYCMECRQEPNAVFTPYLNNMGNFVSKRDLKAKHNDDGHLLICGRGKFRAGLYRRDVEDLEDSSDDYIHDDLHLNKILGGRYSIYGDVPWMATILYHRQHMCGGAILNEFWVISAAHCFIGHEKTDFTVVVGDHRLHFRDTFEEIFEVETLVLHEQYKADEISFDIALVKIKAKMNGRGFQFNRYVQPVCLPDSTDNRKVGEMLLFSGWGRVSEGSKKSEILKETILPVVDYGNCHRLYPNATTPNLFCAGYVNGFTDVCRGDGGGPATFLLDGISILYGLSVFSTGCSLPNFPSAFVRVPSYRGWIVSTIRANSNEIEQIMPLRKLFE